MSVQKLNSPNWPIVLIIVILFVAMHSRCIHQRARSYTNEKINSLRECSSSDDRKNRCWGNVNWIASLCDSKSMHCNLFSVWKYDLHLSCVYNLIILSFYHSIRVFLYKPQLFDAQPFVDKNTMSDSRYMCIDETCVEMWIKVVAFFIAKLKTKAQPKCVCTRYHHFTEHLLLAIIIDTHSMWKKVRVQMKYFSFLCYLHTTTKKSSSISVLRYFFFFCTSYHFASMPLILSADGIVCHCSNFEIITHRELFRAFHYVLDVEMSDLFHTCTRKRIQCVLFT